jgi:hypothetical protein
VLDEAERLLDEALDHGVPVRPDRRGVPGEPIGHVVGESEASYLAEGALWCRSFAHV